MDYRGSMSRQDFWRAMAGYVLVYVFFALISVGMLNYVIPALPIRNGFVLADFFLYLPTVFLVISFLPVLAAQARRLRDAGFSHWWLLLIIIPYMGWFILLILLVYPTRSAYVAN